MITGRLESARNLLKPKLVRWSGGALLLIGTWDVLSSQFGLLTLGEVLGLSGRVLPLWAWFDLILLVLIYALFEYQRQSSQTSEVLETSEQMVAAIMSAVTNANHTQPQAT